MKKVSIIYWSNAGNVEVLAEEISRGAKAAGAEVSVKLVSEAKVEEVLQADAVAFGSPSMDNNRIEQQEMEPFIKQFNITPNSNKSLALFGSYGWDDGQFMKEWEERMKGYDFNVVASLAVKEAPTEEQLRKAYDIGQLLAK